MTRMPELPAAASALMAPVVNGPRRSGLVVASFPTCVYAVLDDPDLPASQRLVALVGPGALGAWGAAPARGHAARHRAVRRRVGVGVGRGRGGRRLGSGRTAGVVGADGAGLAAAPGSLPWLCCYR